MALPPAAITEPKHPAESYGNKQPWIFDCYQHADKNNMSQIGHSHDSPERIFEELRSYSSIQLHEIITKLNTDIKNYGAHEKMQWPDDKNRKYRAIASDENLVRILQLVLDKKCLWEITGPINEKPKVEAADSKAASSS